MRGVFGVFPAPPGPVDGVAGLPLMSCPSVLSMISATVVADVVAAVDADVAAADVDVTDVDVDVEVGVGVGVAGGSIRSPGSIIHGGSSFKPSSLFCLNKIEKFQLENVIFINIP